MKIKFLTTILFSIFFLTLYGQEVRIASVGDFGAATVSPEFAAYELAVANLVKSWDEPNNPLDAIITVGDNNYPIGLQEDLETNIGQFYGPFIQGHPDFLGGANRFFPSIGNHDYGEHDCNLPGDPSPYLNYFQLPGNELYFDYVMGNVHFFVVDSDCHQPDGVNTTSVQAQWLEATMTASPHPWKIVYFHHAPYASTTNGSTGSSTLRWDFKAWGATAVIGGHYHFYERLMEDDLLYFVNGSGGNHLHDFSTPIAQSQFGYNEKHGAMLMTFTDNQANFKMVNIDGEIVDNYTISLGNPCASLGGDTDHDGVCDTEDCAPNNPLLPAPEGFACDDNNPFTSDDVFQTDGCTCEGTFNPGGFCEEILDFEKLGEANDHAYYRSENTAAGWADAQNQSVAHGGYLVSMEDQAEKDFIDSFVSGVGDDWIYFIGLSRNQNGNFVWSSDQSVFDAANYSTSPWSGSGLPSTNDFVTLRKWNPTSNVSWGAESGNAHRRFIIEKPCSIDCSNLGGDSDGDGVCDDFDCLPNDGNFPQLPGTSCDDNNTLTVEDMIQSDGCTCLGTTDTSNPCDGQGGDSDGDGICDDEDCAPNDADLPTAPNTTCDDGDENTINDVIQADGCTCQGIIETPDACGDIPNFTKLGESNGKGYYRSEMTASGWDDAALQSTDNGGNLLSMKTQAEKDFIDQFISGTGEDKVYYIGLSQDVGGAYIWSSDNSEFDENNYTTSPWSGGSAPTSGQVVSLIKWNENHEVRWGAESGKAHRKFIFEKGCSNDCESQGGDSDGDGICDDQDCAPTNANFPTFPNSTCDDGNPNTINDVIQEDGCTCLGEPEGSLPNCEAVTISAGNGSITIDNLNAPIEIVKVYDATYNQQFVCINSCADTEIVSNLIPGIYHIEIRFFTEFWEPASVCHQDITVPGNSNLNQNDKLGNNFSSEKTYLSERQAIPLQNQFSVFPNPVKDRLYVKCTAPSNSNRYFKIYNSLGQFKKELVWNASGSAVFDFGVSDLEVGIYFIYYENEEGRSEIQRFIVQ